MLREIFIIIIIIVSVVGVNFFIPNYLDNSSKEFVSKLDELSTKLKEKENIDYDEIKKELDNLEEKWYEVESVWMLIILHSDLDLVDKAFKELQATLEIKNAEQSYVNAKRLQFLIESVTKKDLFELKNIF